MTEPAERPRSATARAPFRLAILASHPIPYQVPLFRELAGRPEVELIVLYGDRYGTVPRRSEWGVDGFVWAGGITEGYPHVFLRNWAPRPDPSTFTGKLNPGLPRALKRFRPDAVLVTGWANPYHLLGLASARAIGAPVIYLADSARMPTADLRGRVKDAWLRRVLFPRIDAFLAIGTRNRDQYRAFGVPESRLFDFPYAIDNEHFRREASRLAPRRAELRATFGVPDRCTCVGYSGRLAPEKNLAELVRGVARSRDGFLLVVGSGPEQAVIESLAREHLAGRHRFVGFLNQDRLSEAYAAMDLIALTSTREAWGLVLNEAMNFGVPIVVADTVGAAPDLAVTGETGFVYPLGDVDALARAIDEVAEGLRTDRDVWRRRVVERVAAYGTGAQADGVIAALRAIQPAR